MWHRRNASKEESDKLNLSYLVYFVSENSETQYHYSLHFCPKAEVLLSNSVQHGCVSTIPRLNQHLISQLFGSYWLYYYYYYYLRVILSLLFLGWPLFCWRSGRKIPKRWKTPWKSTIPATFWTSHLFFIDFVFYYFSGGGNCRIGKLSFHELGIAKLSGFREWFSIHPISSESDGLMDLDLKTDSQKMIIFAHHHKVLDGVQVRFSFNFF